MNETIEWSPSDMVEIFLAEPDDFLKVRETLSRIGIASRREENVLFQSAHILHKQGRYFILHFKELFALDGKPSSFTDEDRRRRNTIVRLLADWSLLRIAKPEQIHDTSSLKTLKVISFNEKDRWDLRTKYTIGNVRKTKATV
mgnify:CR=1 FL=1